MIELRRIEAKPGLVFDASVAGDAAAPLVLLLHGFAVSRHLYDAQLPALARAGFLHANPGGRIFPSVTTESHHPVATSDNTVDGGGRRACSMAPC